MSLDIKPVNNCMISVLMQVSVKNLVKNVYDECVNNQ